MIDRGGFYGFKQGADALAKSNSEFAFWHNSGCFAYFTWRLWFHHYRRRKFYTDFQCITLSTCFIWQCSYPDAFSHYYEPDCPHRFDYSWHIDGWQRYYLSPAGVYRYGHRQSYRL